MQATALSPIQDEAIRQLIVIDGKTWAAVSAAYDLSVDEARAAYARADAAGQARSGSMADAWRESVVHVCLDVASQAQTAFEKSQKKKVKKIKKDGPNGMQFETHVETSVGDPRFLNTRLAAVQSIAQIQIPKLPQEFNVNTRSQHDITVKMESMSDEELEKLATVARLEQDGLIFVDAQNIRNIEAKVVESIEAENENNNNPQLPDSGAGPNFSPF